MGRERMSLLAWDCNLDRLIGVHRDHDRTKPPEHVLRAFGADGLPAPLAGGRGLAWRAGSLVVKPADTTEDSLAWQAATLGRANGDQLRVAMPRRSARGTFVFDGWMASSFCAGSHQRGRWLDIVAVADRFHVALSGVGRPAFVVGRDDPWANADRVAWGEISMTPYHEVGTLVTVSQYLPGGRRPFRGAFERPSNHEGGPTRVSL